MASSANPPDPDPDPGDGGGARGSSSVSSSSSSSSAATKATAAAPRTRKRKKNTSGASLSWELITSAFHLPLTEAAKKIGVCDTVLKQQCRKLGLKKWPHRQFRQITNMIEQLERQLGSPLSMDPSMRSAQQVQLEELQGAMHSLLTTGQLTLNITKRRKSLSSSGTPRGAVKQEQEGGTSTVPASVPAPGPFASQSDHAAADMVPETGFRTSSASTSSTSTLLGGVLEESPALQRALLEARGNLTTSETSQLLEMDFSMVFDDEQEAKFDSSGSIS